MSRQRQPVELLLAKGKKHLTKAEIAARTVSEVKAEPVKQIRAPDYLPNELKKEFSQLARELLKLELVGKLDADILARYVMSRDAWIQAHEKAFAALYQNDDAKTVGQWARIEKIYFEQCQSCAAAMGLTISSRCKLVLPKQPDDPAEKDPIAQLLLKQDGEETKQNVSEEKSRICL